MKIFIILIALSLFALPNMSQAKSQKEQKKLGTQFNFEDLTVKGKYQYADEAAAVVEREKEIDDLLQPRKHFKDRLSESAARN
ncbi:MAG: hypothetical protein AB7F59_08635 [Bdellovibrionales bacterium]